MKKLTLMFLLLGITGLGFSSCSVKQSENGKEVTVTVGTTEPATQQPAIAKDVPPAEFKKLIEEKKDAIVLDVRTPKEVAEGHLANSVNIDYFADNFKDEIAKLDKNKPVLVYCHSGRRSGNTKKMLQEMGFKEIYNLSTGIVGWEEAGYPVEK